MRDPRAKPLQGLCDPRSKYANLGGTVRGLSGSLCGASGTADPRAQVWTSNSLGTPAWPRYGNPKRRGSERTDRPSRPCSPLSHSFGQARLQPVRADRPAPRSTARRSHERESSLSSPPHFRTSKTDSTRASRERPGSLLGQRQGTKTGIPRPLGRRCRDHRQHTRRLRSRFERSSTRGPRSNMRRPEALNRRMRRALPVSSNLVRGAGFLMGTSLESSFEASSHPQKDANQTSNEGFSVIIQAKKRSRPPSPRRRRATKRPFGDAN